MNKKYNNHNFVIYKNFQEKHLNIINVNFNYYICTNCNNVAFQSQDNGTVYLSKINKDLNQDSIPSHMDFQKFTCEELIIKKILE